MLAYRAFLAEHAIDPNSIQRMISDFVRLPLITKANYLRRYPLLDLCRDGRLERVIWWRCRRVQPASQPSVAPIR
ncbi:MAG: hypothetical protein U0074_16010 [Kouleothrix sp.]